ncbi:hypothetical protein F5Y18DRAFT_244603 [Xylariaceae sp. FL1019]|nr:hypothetical protein F5Y18DRAFT_244603 [Xylariaceae sp. FL1019]
MLPPIDSAVLKNNPQFQKLYSSVTTDILNHDASTKHDPTAKQRDDVRQHLQAHRLRAARVQLLHTAIQTAIPPEHSSKSTQESQKQQQQLRKPQHGRSKSNTQARQPPPSRYAQPSPATPSLPPDLVHLLLLIPPFLTNVDALTPSAAHSLLSSPPFANIQTLFPSLLDVVSARLNAQATMLARVLSPTTNASFIHRAIPSLPSLASDLVTSLADTRLQLSRARLAATASFTAYLDQHTDALSSLVNILESKHGPAATSACLRAADAQSAAQTWALAAEALLHDTRHLLYPPQAQAALANYRRHLRDAGQRLEDKARVREAELADYGVVVTGDKADGEQRKERRKTLTADHQKERTMREMARVWREMETRLGEIQSDLRRLR